jgi:hypothetical protein
MEYLGCDPANVQTDGTCSQPVWTEAPTVLPPLSISDAQEIWAAIALLWVVGYGIRLIRRLLGV